MAASQPAYFNVQEFTDGGLLLVGGRLYTYAYGTTTQKTAYTDPDGLVPQTYTSDGAGGQYIALNARGELPAPLYLADGSYDLSLKRSDGSTVWTRKADGVDNANNSLKAQLAASSGSSLIGFIQSGTGAVARTAQDKFRDIVSVKDFGAVGDGVTDDTAALQLALDNRGGRRLYMPAGRYKTITTLKAISTAANPLTLVGDGVGASIIDFQPAAYNASNDTAVWFGNSTDNVPSSIYQCSNLTIEDLSIYVNANTRIGLRLRETQHTSVKRVFIGPETWSSVTDLICLFADGAVHCNFEMLDLAPRAGYTTLTPSIRALRIQNSATLDRTAGSGSGAGFTSTAFRSCYFHYAGIVAEVYSANEVLFDSCIFEACHQGVQLYDVFLPQFSNCYFEALNTYPICVNGTDVRVGASVVVSGGYYQANSKSGYNSDSFIYANNAAKIVVRDVQMYGAVAVGQQVTVAGTCHSIQIDAKPFPQYGAGTGNIEVAATNPFATTNGSNLLTVTQAAHGRVVGDTVGFRGFTTPLSQIPVNIQYCKVTSVVDANTYRALPLIGATINANATASGLGGTGTIIYYPPNAWVNSVIALPNRTRFNDADLIPVTFQRAFVAALSAANLYLQNDSATTGYILDKWTYVMYAYKGTSVSQTVAHTNYCYIIAQLPTGYEQALILNTIDGSVPINSYRGADITLGYKLPPGTILSVQVWDTGGVGGVTYTKSDYVRIFLAPCNDEYYIG